MDLPPPFRYRAAVEAVPSVGRVIWITGWEMQCCGEAFRLGSTIEWPVSDPDVDWLDLVLGPDAAEVTDAYDGHPTTGVPVRWLTGNVVSIAAVFCRWGPTPGGDPQIHSPLRGSATVEVRSLANGWEPESDVARFAGYLAEVAEP
jgi:hypothetical protein